jgi:hypothetical protein
MIKADPKENSHHDLRNAIISAMVYKCIDYRMM